MKSDTTTKGDSLDKFMSIVVVAVVFIRSSEVISNIITNYVIGERKLRFGERLGIKNPTMTYKLYAAP
ncbi:hypothetical protein BLOT_011233 [Blomia tropicalis]|nr:hypothetical protein BLOT_011233 [Blomia tropicalis]